VKKIIFTKDCNYEGKIVKANKELNPKKVKDWDLIWKLNEKGHQFISSFLNKITLPKDIKKSF